jgi:hypothetical protein
MYSAYWWSELVAMMRIRTLKTSCDLGTRQVWLRRAAGDRLPIQSDRLPRSWWSESARIAAAPGRDVGHLNPHVACRRETQTGFFSADRKVLPSFPLPYAWKTGKRRRRFSGEFGLRLDSTGSHHFKYARFHTVKRLELKVFKWWARQNSNL